MRFSLFDSDNSLLLPAFCKPYPDELLSSWLARLSFNHGLRANSFHKLSLLKKTENISDVDRYITNEEIDRLARQTNCGFDEVKNTTLLYYANRLHAPITSATPEKWLLARQRLSKKSPKVLYKSGLLYCPCCFSRTDAEPYYKREWRLAISFVCPDCGCYLIEKCPHCDWGVSYIKHPFAYSGKDIGNPMVTCEYCLNNMANCEIEKAPEYLIRMQNELNTLLADGLNDKGQCSESYLKALYHIANLILKGGKKGYSRGKMRSVIKNVYNIYGIFINTIKQTRTFRDIPLKKRADIITAAHSLLDAWPVTFLDICKEHQLNSQDILVGFHDAPDWFREPIIAHSVLTPYVRPIRENLKECTVMMKKNNFTRIEDYDYESSRTGSY